MLRVLSRRAVATPAVLLFRSPVNVGLPGLGIRYTSSKQNDEADVPVQPAQPIDFTHTDGDSPEASHVLRPELEPGFFSTTVPAKRDYSGCQVFDLLVVGSGPSGQRAAVAARKLGKSVALIDKGGLIGGVCVHTGTIPSKTLREGIIHVSGYRHKAFYGRDYVAKAGWTAQKDLRTRINKVIQRETELVRSQLLRNRVELYDGHASFVDPHTLQVVNIETQREVFLHGKHILLATGSAPAHNSLIPIDNDLTFDSDGILNMKTMPRDLIVVGGGVIGLEYATMMGMLDSVKVTLIESRDQLLPFVDSEIIDALKFQARGMGVTFRLNETVESVEIQQEQRCVVANLKSGKRAVGDTLLYTVGRQGNSKSLNLEAAGLVASNRGTVDVNSSYQTSVDHIYATGDLIGFPALASTSMNQGRIAVCSMFQDSETCARLESSVTPYGIYTIPEISMVGETETALTEACVPYEVGIAMYSELAKGTMAGDVNGGMVKILFHRDSLKLLGVHCFGESATELVHIGMMAMMGGVTVAQLRDMTFNVPTFAEAYKTAALDGMNKLRHITPR